MSRRRIKPEELELWNKVTQTAKQLEPEARNAAIKMPEQPARKPAVDPLPPIPKFKIGARAKPKTSTAALPQTVSDHLAKAPVQMDRKAFTRLKRGKLVPEARLDLHGMTLDQAHPALIQFILTSQARGLRLVLVITGKGDRDDPHDPMPRRRGVLKRQVPVWLRMAPVGQAVLQIAEAHIRHGGTGAYYVYLRR